MPAPAAKWDLRDWIPVALHLEERPFLVDWVPATLVDFDAPLIAGSLRQRHGADGRLDVARTSIAALREQACAPGADDPRAIVTHVSRCGSTLLARLLGAVPGLRALSEPPGLTDAIAALADGRIDEATFVGIAQDLFRVIVKVANANEPVRPTVIKEAAVAHGVTRALRKALPAVDWIFVGRSPVEVMASIFQSEQPWPAFVRWHAAPSRARWLTSSGDGAPASPGAEGPVDHCARCLATFYRRAAADAAETLLIDHRELPRAVWDRVLPYLGVDVDERLEGRLLDRASLDAKRPGSSPYRPDADDKRALARADVRAAAALVEEDYARFLAAAEEQGAC